MATTVEQDEVPFNMFCYSKAMLGTSGFWTGDNPLAYPLALFLLQAILIIITSRTLNFFLARLRQPRYAAEALAGIVLGPSGLGRMPAFTGVAFPAKSIVVLETMGNLGLIYFLFLVGLQVDVTAFSRAGKRAWFVTSTSVALPVVVEILAYLTFRFEESESFAFFLAASLSITAYPVLARVLAELKLLHTDVGKLALSAAILSNCVAWVILGVAIALTGNHLSVVAPFGIFFSGILFVIVLYFSVRPAAKWVSSNMKEGEALKDVYVTGILVGVLLCGLAADTIGLTAAFGAFVMGLVIPNGPVVAALIEKLEDFVTCFLLPLYYAVVGLAVNVKAMDMPRTYGILILVFGLGAAARVGATVLVGMCYAMPLRRGLCLGVLMNAKGLMGHVVLLIALDKGAISSQAFSTLILMSVLTTMCVTPLATLVYRPSRRLIPYKRRTIQRGPPDSDLRMVACIHSTRNVPSILALLDISHPTKKSPIFVYNVHLVELTGRESAMLIVHDAQDSSDFTHYGGGGNSSSNSSMANLNRVKPHSDQIIKAFESYEQRAGGVSVQPLTIVSAYSNMHEDVCNLAEDEHATLLVLPFHKQRTVDGNMEVVLNPGIRTLNQNVLTNAPCSVGILVDRGLTTSGRVSMGQYGTHHVAMLFIGGPDDREALAYVLRMVDHPDVNVTVIRFLDASSIDQVPPTSDASVIDVETEAQREKLLDEDSVKEFNTRTDRVESVTYVEKAIANAEEMVKAMRTMESSHDLYVVGRGEGRETPMTAGMTDWTDCAELGPIGDLLSSSDFTSTVSVLVVQQYKEKAAWVPS